MRRSLLPLSILLGAGIPAFAQTTQLTLTQAGMNDGFQLTSFVKGFQANSGNIGPMGVAVAGTGNVIVHNIGDQTNYVFPDTDGQTTGSPHGSQPFNAFPPGYTFAYGSVWGSQGYDNGKNALPLVKFNDDGSVNTIFSNLKIVSNGMWTNPANGHIIGVSPTALYDIDVSSGTPMAHPIPNTNVTCNVPGRPPVQANPGGDGVTVSPDGKIAYIADNTYVTGFNIATGACVFGPVAVPSEPDGLAVISSPNAALNGQIVVNTNGGQIYLMDPQTGSLTLIADHGTRGDYLAPDNNNGSLFVTQSTEVFRLQCAGCRFGNAPLTISACPATATSIPYGVAISPLSFTASGGNGAYNWSLTSNPGFLGLTPNGSSATVTGTPNASGPFSFTVTLSDTAGTPVAMRTCGPINVGMPLSISACPATANPIPYGVPLSPLAFTGSGGLGAYTWSLTLNPGFLALASNGVSATVTGTPNASGPFSFTVTLSDSGGTPAATRTCGPINVGLPLSISACPTTASSVPFGLPLSPLPFTGSGGIGSYTWSLSPLSSFLNLLANGASATVTGTPNVTGPFSFTLTLKDSAGTPAAMRTCGPITVLKPLTLNGACPSARAASQYSIALIASGGNGMYSLSFTGASWLALSAATGVAGTSGFFNTGLTGFPPGVGTYPVNVTLTDTGGSAATTFSCSVTINPAPLVVTSACPTSPLTVGTPFFEFLTANGSLPPYSWSISGGSLPAGLSLVGNTITGTPSGPPSTSNFNIVVTTDDQTAQIPCSLSVTGSPLTNTSVCPAATGTVGVPYGPFPLSANGGNPANYVFSFVNGSAPAGVGISGSSISGTPTAAGTSSFSIQVASGTLTALAGPCVVAIAPALALSVSCPATAQAGSPVSAPFTAMGGQMPYSFSLAGQPSWLSIGSTAVSGIAPADAGNTTVPPFTVTVTDASKISKSVTCPAFPITAQPPTLIGSCPNPIQTAGTPLAVSLSVMGGQEPFNWTLDNGGDPDLALASSTGRTNSVTGTLTKQGSFTFTVGVAGLPLALTCPITIGPPSLTITASPACPTSPVAFGTRFSTTLTAPGANGSYSWNVTPNPPFSSSPATGQSTTVSAALSAAGPTGFTATLIDSAGATAATYNCQFTVAPLVVPPITITPTPITTTLSPVPITLTFASPLPADLTGILSLTFTSKAFNPVDNPMVTFSTCGTANCGTSPIRTYQFTVPAGTTSFPLNVMVQVGRVYGTIQLQLTSLMLGNLSVLPSPAPSTSFDVPAQAPVISAVQIMNFTPTGFTVQVTGYSTPRDISDPVTLTFTAAPDATVQGAPLTYSVSSFISTFFGKNSDSMFTLNIPVAVTGDITAIASVTVSLKNSVGTSAPVTHSVP